jgi:uncharacterized protein (DUF849 family)
MGLMLQAALNGDRDHPATPRTPQAVVLEARAAVDAGADVVHVHVFGRHGTQTLDGTACAAVVRAVRAGCPATPVSLTTSSDIERDPERRLALLAGWTELPDLVTANMGEEGVVELCDMLVARGVGIEAGLLSLADAERFVALDIAGRCARVLVEPLDAEPEDAVGHAAAIERTLADAGIGLEQVHHGEGIASWAVNLRAIERGHGIRTGLEDTPVLPDGRVASGNAELVATAAAMLRQRGAPSEPFSPWGSGD